MRGIAAVLGLVFLLTACVGPSRPSVMWGQQQSAYNKAAAAIIFYRAPCVDTRAYPNAGPDNPLCRISDAAWAIVKPLLDEADALLQVADALIQVGQAPQAVEYIASVSRIMERVLLIQLQAQGAKQ